MDEWAERLLREARVGHLATSDADGSPHVVAVCYVVIADVLYTPIDDKPKRGRQLTRVRNVAATGRAALVADHYDEDWTQLAWVQVRGPAGVLGPESDVHANVVAALREKYPQYRLMALERSLLIAVQIEQIQVWRWEPPPRGHG